MFDAILVDGAIFLKDSLHGAKKSWGVGAAPPPHLKTPLSWVLGFENQPAWHRKARGLGGVQPPRFANTFITGSERVHMGSVSAGAKILEATLRRVPSLLPLFLPSFLLAFLPSFLAGFSFRSFLSFFLPFLLPFFSFLSSFLSLSRHSFLPSLPSKGPPQQKKKYRENAPSKMETQRV